MGEEYILKDGRFFTDYINANIRDQEIKNKNNIKSIYEFKHYLIDNTNNLIEDNNKKLYKIYVQSILNNVKIDM
jgi:hypothetical protein